MAAGEADRRADAVGVEERSAVRCPLMKRLYISMPPDLTMMVEEALALIERPPPPEGARDERADKTHVYINVAAVARGRRPCRAPSRIPD
jgi:hypothetical protein